MWSSIEASYKEAAARLGLTRFQSTPMSVTISGTLDGVEVAVSRIASSQCIVRAMVQPPAHLGLAITPRSLGGKLVEALVSVTSVSGTGTPLGLLFGGDVLHLGEPAFDDAFTLHGHDAASVAAVLTPNVRDVLWALRRAELWFVLTDVYAQTRRRLIDGEEIEGDARAAAALARAVGQAVAASGAI